MTLQPWRRQRIETEARAFEDSIAQDPQQQFTIEWREVGDDEWCVSIVIPQRVRGGGLFLRIIEGSARGEIVPFPCEGIQYARCGIHTVSRLVHAAARQQEQMRDEHSRMDEQRRYLSQDRRDQLHDWHEIDEQRSRIQGELHEEKRRLESTRQHDIEALRSERQHQTDAFHAEHSRIVLAQQELQHATRLLTQQKDEASSNFSNAQEDLANRRLLLDEEVAAMDEERRFLSDKTTEIRQDFAKREAEINARSKQIAAENKNALGEKKRLVDEFNTRMAAMTSQKLLFEQQVAAASASAERHKEEATISRGILSAQNAKIEELTSCVADLKRQLKNREPARDHSSESSSVSVSRSRRNDARPATDDEDEPACESAFRFWKNRDKGLDISERSTSQYLAGEISLEAFTADWRRRLLLPQNSHESIPILVEEMIRRLRTAHQIVTAGAKTAKTRYLHCKNLRDAIEAASRLQLTIAKANLSVLEKFSVQLRKNRNANRARKTMYLSIDALVTELKLTINPPNKGGGRKRGARKTSSTPHTPRSNTPTSAPRPA